MLHEKKRIDFPDCIGNFFDRSGHCTGSLAAQEKDLICDDFDDDLLTDEDEDAEYIAAQYMDHPAKEEAEEENEPEEQEETSSDEDDSLAPDVEL